MKHTNKKKQRRSRVQVATLGRSRAKRRLDSQQSSEEQFRTVAQFASDAIISVNNHGNIILWNNAAETLFGYAVDEVLDQPLTLIMPERFREAFREGMNRMALTGESKIIGKAVEMVGLRKDGCEVPIEYSAFAWQARERGFFTSIVRDITERKRMEAVLRQARDELELRVQERTAELAKTNAELRESEERYRQLVELSPDLIAVHCEGKVVFINTAGMKLVGATSPEQVIGKTAIDFVHPDCHETVGERIRQVIQGRKAAPLIEEKFIRLDGTELDVEVAAIPFTYDDKPAVQVVARDITERMRAEEALRESEARFRSLVRNSTDLIAVVDADATMRYASPAVERIMGYTPEEMLGKNAFEFLHPDDLQNAMNVFAEAVTSPGSTASGEFRLRHRDGLWRTVEAISNNQLNDPAVAGVVVNIRDITERKWAEESLRESEERYRSLVETSPDAITLTDLNGIVLTCNQQAAALQGYSSPQELIGKNAFELIAPEDRERAVENARKTLETGSIRNIEYALLRKDGSRLPAEVSASLIVDAAGNPQAFIGVVRDITERKRRDKEIRQRNEELAALNQIGQELNQLAEPSEILELIYTMIGRVLDNKNFYIALYDEANQQVAFPIYTIEGERRAPGSRPVGNGLTEYVIRTRTPLLLPNQVQQGIVERGITSIGRPAQSLVAVPMLVGEKVIGVITLQDYETENVYNAAHVELLVTFAAQAAIAIENARLLEDIRWRARRQVALLRLSTDLAATLDEAEVCRCVVNGLHDTLGYDHVGLFLVDETTGERVLCAGVGWPDAQVGWRIPPGQGLSERPLLDGQLHYTPDVTRDPRYVPGLSSGAEVDVPVQIGDKVGGVLVVESVQLNAFDQDDFDVLSSAANQAGVAISKARLFKAERQRAGELETVRQVSLSLTSSLDLRTVLESILESALRIAAEALDAHIFLYQDDRLTFGAALWAGGQQDHPRVEPRPEGLTFTVARQGQTIVVPDVRTHPLFASAPPSLIGAVVGLPLKIHQRVVGVMNVSYPQPHTIAEAELRVLHLLGDQAAIAIENARLFAETDRRLKHVQALHAIDVAISASHDLRLTLDVLLEQVTAQLGVDAADILLLNPNTQLLEYAAGRGFRSRALQHTHLHLGQGYAGRAVLERRIVSISDFELRLADFPPSTIRNLQSEGFVAYYAAPLVAKGEVKGVLEIFHRTPLAPDPEWLEFLESLAAQATIALDNAELFNNLQRSNIELALAYDTTLEGWARALDLRERDTGRHSERVTEMTLRLAHAIGMSGAELAHVRRGALLHDIGKVGVPDAILLKPGALTDDEWKIMRQHPQFAYEMLAPIAFLRPALDIPYCHHEKWDGTGYSRGLKGEDIPLAARIFAVVDVWDALCSDRPYRAAWPEEKAREYISEQAGKHFDPKVVEVFSKLIADSR